MKKLSLFLATMLVSVGIFAEDRSVEVYYTNTATAIGSYTVKLNVCTEYNSEEDQTWDQQAMTLTDLTHNGQPVYKGTFTEKWGGARTMQFQLYDGDTWKSQVVAFENNWTTSTNYEGKMYDAVGQKWEAIPSAQEFSFSSDVTNYCFAPKFALNGTSWSSEAADAAAMIAAFDLGDESEDGVRQRIFTLTAELSAGTYQYQIAGKQASTWQMFPGADAYKEFTLTNPAVELTVALQIDGNKVTTTVTPKYKITYGDLYLIVNKGSWDVSKGDKLAFDEDKKLYKGAVELTATENYLVPTEKLGSSAGDWDGIKEARYGAESDAAQALTAGTATAMKKGSDKAFKIGAGKYDVEIDVVALTIKLIKVEDVIVEPDKEGFGIQINGDKVVTGVKTDDVTYDEVTYQQYAVKDVELKKDDKIRAYDLKNSVAFAMALDAAVKEEVATKSGDDIIIAADGKYDFYLKIAEGKDNVYIEAAKGSDEQPKEAGYYIAGVAALTGFNWAVNEANKMTVADGLATLEKTKLNLKKGSYEYKVVKVEDGKDDAWIPDGMGNDLKVEITEDGEYTVLFEFVIANDAEGISAKPSKTGDYTEPDPIVTDKLFILGEVNDQKWAPNAGVELTKGDDGKFSVKAQIKGYFSFTTKLAESADDWASIKDARLVPEDKENDVTLQDDVAAKLAANDSDAPKAFTAAAGEYTITVDMTAMTVTIKKEGDLPPVDPPAPDSQVYVMGDISTNGDTPWAANVGAQMEYKDGKYVLATEIKGYFGFTTKLAETADAWDDIKDARLGAAAADTEAAVGQEYEMTAGSDVAWKIATPGVYTITVDLANMKFSIVEGGTPEPPHDDALEDVRVELDLNAPMYNTLGQKVDSNYRGIVIQNGHKFLMK